MSKLFPRMRRVDYGIAVIGAMMVFMAIGLFAIDGWSFVYLVTALVGLWGLVVAVFDL